MTTITKKAEDVLLKIKRAKTYTYEQVLESSISYFNGDELAATTWMNKYAMKDFEENFVEQSPEDMHRRMAREFGRIEADYKLKYNLNGSAKFLSEYGKDRDHLSEGRIFDLFEKVETLTNQINGYFIGGDKTQGLAAAGTAGEIETGTREYVEKTEET